MVSRGVQAVVIWDYQTEEAEQLKALGITPVMVKNETIEDLQASFTAIGQMLGKEERAEQFNTLYPEAYEYLQSFQEQVNAADKPKVLYLRNAELKLQGNDMFIAEALELAGADNVAADLSSITMEEILAIDPDIILMSNFDSFTPADLYENRLDGQDWSQVSAVLNHRVYKTPMGIYRWDAPGVETPLMMRWLAQLIQPEIFAEIDIEQDTRAFFQDYFGYSLTDEDLAQIFAADANADSQ
ncbi:ABC transporter substrate-binding protein [Flavonifractor plautii]|nr:ABC transporter substrate-binding protein [Flavonifractor plautii]